MREREKNKSQQETSVVYLQEQATAENVSGVKPGQSRRLTPTIHSERASEPVSQWRIQLAGSERRAKLQPSVDLLPRGSLTLYTLDIWDVFSNDFPSCFNRGATYHRECRGCVCCNTTWVISLINTKERLCTSLHFHSVLLLLLYIK